MVGSRAQGGNARAMSEFEIARRSQQVSGEEISILQLKGQLDAHTFPVLQRELDAVATGAGAPRVVLDCSSLDYVSSAGLGVLKKMTRQFRDREGDIRLAALTPKIKNVISLLGFDQVIQVHGDPASAVDSYAS